jgi:hypothetical protein
MVVTGSKRTQTKQGRCMVWFYYVERSHRRRNPSGDGASMCKHADSAAKCAARGCNGSEVHNLMRAWGVCIRA